MEVLGQTRSDTQHYYRLSCADTGYQQVIPFAHQYTPKRRTGMISVFSTSYNSRFIAEGVFRHGVR